MISVSFSECLSLASTISSLILSVIAMLYTYYSGRDTGNLNVVSSSSEAFQTMQEENASEQERQNAIETIEKSKNSMMMFLNKMQENAWNIETATDSIFEYYSSAGWKLRIFSAFCNAIQRSKTTHFSLTHFAELSKNKNLQKFKSFSPHIRLY